MNVRDWAEIRKHLYAYTGIDIGLAKSAEDLARLIRQHAALIGELTDLPSDQRFTAYPEPNWAFPTPVEGRTKKRQERLPGDGMRMKIRGMYLELVNMETQHQVIVARPEQEDALPFLKHWNGEVRAGVEGAQSYAAHVDTGTNFYTLVGVWPWSFRAGLVAFRYDRIEDEPATTVQARSAEEDDQDEGRQSVESGA